MIARMARGLVLLGVLAAAAAAMAAPEDEEGEQLWLKGRLLVATDDLEDSNFQKSVVYLIEHSAGGAMGLIVNRRIAEGPLNRLLESLGHDARGPDTREIALYDGGPVSRGGAVLLHSDDYESGDTVTLGDGLALTVPEQALDDIAAGKGPGSSLLVLGHAGWAPGQLEQEIAQGAWHVVDSDPSLVLDHDVALKWERALARRGQDL